MGAVVRQFQQELLSAHQAELWSWLLWHCEHVGEYGAEGGDLGGRPRVKQCGPRLHVGTSFA